MKDFFTLDDLDFYGKRVLVRVDFNVPLDKKTGEIADEKRIIESLPTIRYLIGKNAKIILCSHLGRPDGKVAQSLRMDKVASRLGMLLGADVKKLGDCIGDEVLRKVMEMEYGEVIMLENLRFHAQEEANDKVFSRQLAGLAEL